MTQSVLKVCILIGFKLGIDKIVRLNNRSVITKSDVILFNRFIRYITPSIDNCEPPPLGFNCGLHNKRKQFDSRKGVVVRMYLSMMMMMMMMMMMTMMMMMMMMMNQIRV